MVVVVRVVVVFVDHVVGGSSSRIRYGGNIEVCEELLANLLQQREAVRAVGGKGSEIHLVRVLSCVRAYMIYVDSSGRCEGGDGEVWGAGMNVGERSWNGPHLAAHILLAVHMYFMCCNDLIGRGRITHKEVWRALIGRR